MADLRGHTPSNVNTGSAKSKLVGAILVAVLFAAVGTVYFSMSTAHAAKPVAAKTFAD